MLNQHLTERIYFGQGTPSNTCVDIHTAVSGGMLPGDMGDMLA